MALYDGGKWSALHSYPASATTSNPHNVVVNVVESTNTVRATSPPLQPPISVVPHQTSISITPIQDPVAGTLIAAYGVLTDAEYTNPLPVTQIAGKNIEFGGTGGTTLSPNPATTVGITFTAPSPGQAIPVEQCTNCPLDSGAGNGNNIAIDLPVNGKITLPDGIKGVRLGLLGGTPLTIKYTKGDNTAVTLNTQGAGIFDQEFGEGIKEIQITQVGGSTTSGNARISYLTILDHRAANSEIIQMDFENLSVCPACHLSPLAVQPGFFIALGASPAGTPQNGLTVTARFYGPIADPAYVFSNTASTTYNTITDTSNGVAGDTGAISYTGARFQQINTDICQNAGGDSDGDGICNTWETVTSGHAYIKCPGNDAGGAINRRKMRRWSCSI